MVKDYRPVIVVGAGADGLSLSVLLLQQRIRPLLNDRRPAVSWYPRVRNLNFPTLQVFRRLSIEHEVTAAGALVSRIFRGEALAWPVNTRSGGRAPCPERAVVSSPTRVPSV
jgi:2-polyprenyl-6-methoxyphenol hydroxylase-like FAD-dependent oxidoreductase